MGKRLREAARRAASALVALALLAGQALGAVPATALAQAETAAFFNDREGDVGPFDATAFGCYQMVGEPGAAGVAYCMDGTLPGPRGATYTKEGPADAALSYIVAKGYPNATEICGYDLTPGEARAATQIAVWHHRSYDGVRMTPEREHIIRAALALCAEAEAHAAAGGAALGCGTVWYEGPDRQRVLLTSEPLGSVSVEKSSADESMTAGNGLYSLSGARYGVYRDEACSDLAATIVTDGDGRGSAEGLPVGTYWVREDGAPAGYALSASVTRAEVGAGATARVAASDVPQSNPLGVVLSKADAETGLPSALGAGSLAGATFEVRYYAGAYDEADLPASPDRTWTVTTGEDGTADLSTATGDEPFLDSKGNVCVPLGTVAIRETGAPEGYLASGETLVVRVAGEGDAESVSTYVAPSVPERAKRGDLRLVKAHGRTMARLAGVPFRITSLTTGESHVIVTDANGQASTAASWASHAHRTNANDRGGADPEAGVWFSGTADGETVPDDGRGALPYDRYRVEELRCDANEGLELVSLEASVTRDAVTVDLGTLDDEELPRIGTTLTSAAGTHMAEAAGTITLTDEVAYERLVPGTEYALTGTLVDQSTGEPVRGAGGEPVTATGTFVPRLSSGTTKVEFRLDASSLVGTSVVAFEELTRDGVPVATHADVEAGDQTVAFPAIGTTATDAEDGGHDALADDEVTIVDLVSYRNLVPGLEYEARGTLMDQATGEPVADAAGNPVTATATFVAEEGSGEAEVTFAFDGSALAGRTVVAFEELWHDGTRYATHADLGDEGQSVRLPEVRTTATDSLDGDKWVDADEGQVVTDEVAYRNLTAGEEYVLSGSLVDAETGDVLAKAETGLSPEEPDGTVDLEFELDATGLEGRRLVCYESLSRAGKVVASHEDPEDEGQSVRVPRIGTTATDAEDGDHEAVASDAVRITDRVEYEGLVEGREYEVTGRLVDRDSGEAVTTPDGEPVTATRTFVAEGESGSVEVEFEFDGSALAGRSVVAFETVSHEGKTVATHADIEDEAQTVTITEVPPTPPSGGRLPQTGDEGVAAQALLALGATGLLALAAAALSRKKGGASDE